jgi:hypothetical protein
MGNDRTFRPSAALIAVLAGAAVCWLGVLALLLNLRGVEGKTYLTVFFFIGFFGVFLVYYSTQAIVVHPGGLVVRRFLALTSFDFQDIVKVEVHPGPAMTVYDVFTRQGPIQFSSWFRGHKELLDLIVRGARLEPRQA